MRATCSLSARLLPVTALFDLRRHEYLRSADRRAPA